MAGFTKKSINLAVLASLALLLIGAPAPLATAFSSPPALLSRFQVLGKNKSHSIQSFSKKGFSSDKDDMDESSLFDMDELRARMDQQMNQYYDLLLNEHAHEVRPDYVYIVVFNPDNEAEQGVHTIEFPKGSKQNILLAFESDDECIEFAEMLKNMQFYNPNPQMANLCELTAFCQGLGVPVKVVPRGKGLRPPADNVKELGMNPNLQQDKEKLNRAFKTSNDEKVDASDDLNSAWE